MSSLARRSEVCFGRANRDAAAWPLAARAQQAGGYDRLAQCRCVRSHLTGAHGFSLMLCESWDGSKEKTCYRAPFRGESAERLPEFAAELVRLKVDVTVGIGTLAPLAAKRATTTIPIVMTAAGDPLGSGLVASLARPGGNVTGMSLMGVRPRGQAPGIAQRASSPARPRGCALECGQSVCRARLQRDASRRPDVRDRG